jgi:hypothetical protein
LVMIEVFPHRRDSTAIAADGPLRSGQRMSAPVIPRLE